jgi:hypothetical protein
MYRIHNDQDLGDLLGFQPWLLLMVLVQVAQQRPQSISSYHFLSP